MRSSGSAVTVDKEASTSKPKASTSTSRTATGSSTSSTGPTRSDTSPTWGTWREAVRVVLYRPHLRKTVTIALVVGTVLFSINQLDVVRRRRPAGLGEVGGHLPGAVLRLERRCARGQSPAASLTGLG